MPQYLYPGVYVEEVATEAHAIQGVETSSDSAGTNEETPLRRPNFFPGKLLDAATMQREQNYHREKLRHYILAVHGTGIVWGLGVSIDSASDARPRIIVEPGVAVGGRGDCLTLHHGAAFIAPKNGGDTHLVLRFWEHACPSSPPESTSQDCAQMKEACLIGFRVQPTPPWIALARLIRTRDSWSVDPHFQPQRIRSATLDTSGGR